MQPLFSRALACLVSVSSLLGLGVAVAPAASASDCYGVVWTSGAGGFGIDAGADYVTLCLDAGGVRYVVGVSNVSRVVGVADTFDCADPTTGTVGDPNDPPHVVYRIAFESAMGGYDRTRVCLGAGPLARSVRLDTSDRPVLTLYSTSSPDGPSSCGEGAPGVTQRVGVHTSGFGGPDEWVYAGANTSYLCLGARGFAECNVLGDTFGVGVGDPERCPAGAAILAEVHARVAAAQQTAEDAIDDVEELVDDVTDEVDAAVAEVRRIVDPVVATVIAEVARTVDAVEDALPVAIEPTMGNCSVSVTSLSSPAIEVRRSPTGQVPASVCVVTATSVTRVTIG